MALYGYHVPFRKTPEDSARRKVVFDIIAPYCLSKDDMKVVQASSQQQQDLWLESFANSQKVLLHIKLLQTAKNCFRKYFPDGAVSPLRRDGKMVGLEPGQTILDRCANVPDALQCALICNKFINVI